MGNMIVMEPNIYSVVNVKLFDTVVKVAKKQTGLNAKMFVKPCIC